MERPSSTGFRHLVRSLGDRLILEMCDAKVETMIAVFSSSKLVMVSRTRSRAILSDGHRPFWSMLMASTIRARTPSLPI